MIASEGLKPSAQDLCNYDSNRWMPLEGVYLAQSANQIETYRRAHGLQSYTIVLVDADNASLLPDEDIIDALLSDAFRQAGGKAWDELDEHEAVPPDGDPFWSLVRDRFMQMAGPRSPAPLNEDDLDTLVSWWADFEFFGEGGDIPVHEWADLKDRIVRSFPKMHGLSLDLQSKRHPGAIGFKGPTHIVAIIEVSEGMADVIQGSIPANAMNLVRAMIDDAISNKFMLKAAA